MRFWIPVLGLIAAAGCSHAPTGYVPQPPPQVKQIDMSTLDESSLMPLQKGEVWGYKVDIVETTKAGSNSLGAEASYKVQDISTQGDVKHATMVFSIRSSTQPPEVQQWTVSPKGIFQDSAGQQSKAFSSPQPLLLFPIKDHKSFTWKGSGLCPDGSVGTMTVTAKVLDPEIVDTARGTRVSALPVEIHTDYASSSAKGQSRNTTWFQPGAGIVRYVQDFAAPDRKTHLVMAREQELSGQ
jgi:hypothetical protein